MSGTYDEQEYGSISQEFINETVTYFEGLNEEDRKNWQEALGAGGYESEDLIKSLLGQVNTQASGLSDDIATKFQDNVGIAFNQDTAPKAVKSFTNAYILANNASLTETAESGAAGTAEREGIDPTLGELKVETDFGVVFEPINEARLRQHFAGYTVETKKVMAMELALNGFYGLNGYDLVFDENGDLNDKAFAEAVTSVFNYAMSFGPEGKTITGPAGDKVLMGGLNIPKFFDIITRQTGLSVEEITSLFDAELAEEEASAIQFIDKYSIYEAINTASTNLLGREATKQEKDIFYNMMYELQLSDDAPRAIDISARADASITEGTLAPDPTALTFDYGKILRGIGGGLDTEPSGKDLLEGEYQANRKARVADTLLRLIVGGR